MGHMILLFISALFGVFCLTIVNHALRALKKNKLEILFRDVGRLFFFPKSGVQRLFLASLAAKYLLIFVIALVTAFTVLQETGFPSGIFVMLFAAFVTLVLGDFLPKLLVSFFPKKSFKIFAIFSSLYLWITFPLTGLLFKLPKAFQNALSIEGVAVQPSHVNHEIIQMLEDPEMKASLDPHNKKLITSVLNFKDRIVREVMLPRVSVFSLPHTHTIRSAAEILLVEGYSRVPVYKESIDAIIGILMYKDIFNLYVKCLKGEIPKEQLDLSIESLLKPVFYTPETKKVSHLLQEFRNKQIHLAVVVDEYGGTEGIVTIEDILEEIVGDIADEYDEAKEILYTKGPGGGWIVDAKMPILDIEENFGLTIPQDADYDTLGGYIYHKAGAIPKKGFRIYHDDFELEVLSSTDRLVGSVRIIPRK